MNTKHIFLLSFLVCLASALAGCGGSAASGDSIDAETKDFAPVLCAPETPAAGDEMTCAVDAGFHADCTVFVGPSPVDASFDPDARTVSFVFPEISPEISKDRTDIAYQCGSQPLRILHKGIVAHPEPEPALPPSCDAGSGCPSLPATAGPADEEGGEAVEVIEPSDDAAPAPEAPPAPPTLEPLAVSFPQGENGTETLSSIALGLVRMEWNIDGGGELRQAYLYGPFNRWTGEEGCGEVDGRYLAVNPSGREIAEGQPNHDTYADYLTGTACHAGNCRDFRPAEGPRVCRIDLKDVGRHGRFYTRLLSGRGTFVLAAQGQDGAWRTATFRAETPAPQATCRYQGFDPETKTFTFSASAQNALSMSVVGCDAVPGTVPDGWTPPPMLSRSGDLGRVSEQTFQCRVRAFKTAPLCIAVGLGGVDTDSFEVSLSELNKSLPFIGNLGFPLDGWPRFRTEGSTADDAHGEVRITATSKRLYRVKQGDRVIAQGEMTEIQSRNPVRDHDHTRFSVHFTELDGSRKTYETSLPYNERMSAPVLDRAASGCWTDPDRMTYATQFQLRHVDSFRVRSERQCPGTFEIFDGGAFRPMNPADLPSSYEERTVRYVGARDARSVHCEFSGTWWDETTEIVFDDGTSSSIWGGGDLTCP